MSRAAPCEHEWRINRTWTAPETVPLPSPPGNYTTRTVTYDEWYCVRCRRFEALERINAGRADTAAAAPAGGARHENPAPIPQIVPPGGNP